MRKRTPGEPDLGLKLLTEYSNLYPSVTGRIRRIIQSADPYVGPRVKAVERASEVADRERTRYLVEQFALTPSEAKIALFVGDGGSVKTYAVLTGASESTVRVHLKAIFAKTGVHRQAELVRLINA